MENKIKVSVLIATYNSAKTIKKAIDSVLNQTFKDFELIVLDDGSTDNTKDVIYSIKNDKIVYIHQENKGIAFSRNELLKDAKGDYVIYLDSDDYMEPNTLEKLILKADENDCDAVVCNYRYVFEDGSKQDIVFKSFDNKSVENDSYILLDVMPQPWNKIVKRKIMIDSGLKFPDGLVFEDLCFYSCLMPYLKNISMIDDVLINYVQLGSSIMSEAKAIKKTIYDFDKVIKIINDYYQNNYRNKYNKELEGLFALNAREIIDGIFKNKNIDINEKEKAISSILNTINKEYPKWYKNQYYLERFIDKNIVYKVKRRIIDMLLAREKYEIILGDIVK